MHFLVPQALYALTLFLTCGEQKDNFDEGML